MKTEQQLLQQQQHAQRRYNNAVRAIPVGKGPGTERLRKQALAHMYEMSIKLRWCTEELSAKRRGIN